MKYNRFEELPVWKDAIQLAVRVFALTAKPVFRRYPGVRDKIERSSVSVSNNIAEGFERGTTNELLNFLYISRGSCGETRSVLCLCNYLPGFEKLKSEIADLRLRAESISRADSGLVRFPAEHRHSGAAVLNRPRAAAGKRGAGAGRIPQRT